MTGNHEIVFTRTFDAPRELVFRAFTEPELIARWWVPKDEQLVVEALDARDGGSWRFRNTQADGTRYTFHGVFHSVRPDRIVQTFEYGGMPGQVALETVTLAEVDGRTVVTDSSVFQSVEARDAMGGGSDDADGGANESMDRLAELLSGL